MKLHKKVYVYGSILTASVALLGSQALVRKPDPRLQKRALSANTDVPTQPADAGESNSAAPQISPTGESALSADARVERLQQSLSALQALLPADRMQELEKIGRAWTNDSANHERSASLANDDRAPDASLEWDSQSPPPAATAAAFRAESGGFSSEFGFAAPTRDSLQDWLAKNPLCAIVVGPSRGLACFGHQFYGPGDALPLELGSVERIEARSVVLSCNGVQRHIPLNAFVPRALAVASPQPATIVSPNTPALVCYTHPGLPLQISAERYPSLTLARDVLTPVSRAGTDGRPLHALKPGAPGTVPWLSYSADAQLGRVAALALGAADPPLAVHPVFESALVEALRATALEGLGVAWLPGSLIADDLNHKRLVRAGPVSLDLHLSVRVYAERSLLSGRLQALWDCARQRAEGLPEAEPEVDL